MSTINTPVLSDAAKALFLADLGQANLDAFLAADLKDPAALHLTAEEGNVAQAEMIAGMPDTFTIEQFCGILETGAAKDAEEAARVASERVDADQHAAADVAAVEEAGAEGDLTVDGVPATTEAAVAALAEPAAPSDTAGTLDQAFEAPVDAGVAGSEVADTAESPEPVAAPSAIPRQSHVVPNVMAETKAVPDQPEWFNNLGVFAKALKQAFDQYQLKMKPRTPVNDEDIARNQTSLARIIFGTINTLEGKDFDLMFGHILAQFHKEASGVFHELYVNRGMDVIELSSEDRRLFNNVINMIKLTADPAGRSISLKQVDLNKTLIGSITEAGRQKVYGFYNL